MDQALESIGSLDTRISSTERRLNEVESRLERRIESSLKNLPASLDVDGFPPLLGGPSSDGTSFGTSGSLSYASALSAAPEPAVPVLTSSDRRERDYWRCRKALRFRPVGDGDEDRAAKKFMVELLKLDESFISTLGAIKAERVPFGPKNKNKKELLVHFSSVDARDVVRSAATNLAGCGPDHGVRLEIPHFLRPAMKAPQSVSYDITQKHRDERRNILFDDERMDLVLDFCLTDGRT